MRVCIITEANPVSWASLYVEAFRARCEVITVGPLPKGEDLKWWGLGQDSVVANDITVSAGEIEDLEALLPGDWDPDLVVTIASSNHVVLKNTHLLRCPSAFISIDTFQNLADFEHARYYDFVFAAQREYAGALGATGSVRASWLPLACSRARHHAVDVALEGDLAFVGSVRAHVHRHRVALLEVLRGHFSVVSAENVFGEAYCRAFGRGKVALNLSALNELNMRVFEVMSMGRLLLTDRLPAEAGLETLFEDGVHLVLFDGEADLVEKVRYYLADDAAREKIARAGQACVHAEHTYGDRVDTILGRVGDAIPDIGSLKGLRARHGGNVPVTYLPKGCTRLVDIGLGLGLSKHGLRRAGIVEFHGIAACEKDGAARRGRYDGVSVWPGAFGGGADAVVLSGIEALPCTPEEAVGHAKSLLVAGGTLILHLSGGVMAGLGLAGGQEEIGVWLQARDFHVVYGRLTAGGECWVAARKRTRRLKPLLIGLNGRYPVVGSVFGEGHFDTFPEDA